MIIDSIKNAKKYYCVHPSFEKAFEALAAIDSDYFDLIKKPYLAEGEIKQEMDEEEKQRQRDLLMAQLETMQRNFEMSHGKG